MWVYEKKLQYPVKIKNTNAQLAKFIISQYGGPDGELGASLRYLSQRFTMPDNVTKGILNDIGSEELGHLEMIGAIVYQLTKNLTAEEAKKAANELGYPVLVRPSYVLGGQGMQIAICDEDIDEFIGIINRIAQEHPNEDLAA